MSDPDLDGYLAFVRTIDEGSIAAAARALGLSRPAVSRQIAALEAQLGVALIERGGHSAGPTPTGLRVHAEAAPHVEALARLQQRLIDSRDSVEGRLRIAAPPVLGPMLARVLVELQTRHPALEIELLTEVRHVDLRAEGVEVAVRAGRIGDPELIQRRLGRSRVGAFAAPDYIARRGRPAGVDGLVEHARLRGVDRAGRPQRYWPLYDGGRVAVQGPFCSNDQRALLDAARAGGGIALLSAVTADDPCRRHELVPVLPLEVGAPLDLFAVTTRRTLQPARVRACVEALVRWGAAFEARSAAGDGGSRPAGEPA